MATIITTGQINGTSIKSTLTVTVSDRTATSFKLNCSAVTQVTGTTANAVTDPGYEIYTGYITVSGTGIITKNSNYEVKPKSQGLSGPNNDAGYPNSCTKSTSFTVYTTTSAATTATVKFYVHTNKTDWGSTQDTTTASGTVSVPAAIITPDPPVIIHPSEKTIVEEGEALHIQWQAPSQSITGYKIELIKDEVTILTEDLAATATEYTYSEGLGENSEAYFKIAAFNSDATSKYVSSPKFTTIIPTSKKILARVKVNGAWKCVVAHVQTNSLWKNCVTSVMTNSQNQNELVVSHDGLGNVVVSGVTATHDNTGNVTIPNSSATFDEAGNVILNYQGE